MSAYIPETLKTRIIQQDGRCCCYCQTKEENSGIPMTYDHIQPISKSGNTTFENVCLACRPCNEFKGSLTQAKDPLTGNISPLFNPRKQDWLEHFAWSNDGTKVEGMTAIGRATIAALRMNNSVIVAARLRWVESGWHPPENYK